MASLQRDPPSTTAWWVVRRGTEASVATLGFFNDKVGVRLKTIYVARMPEPNKATTVAASLEEESDRLSCASDLDLNIVFASDGAARQWDALRRDPRAACPKDLTWTPRWTSSMDFHVAEYVQEAAEAIEGPRVVPQRAHWQWTWQARPSRKQDDGADTVLPARCVRGFRPVEFKTREKQLRWRDSIHREPERGRAHELRGRTCRRNYPIGTGITEAAAKTIVGTRMKRAGSRFSQHWRTNRHDLPGRPFSRGASKHSMNRYAASTLNRSRTLRDRCPRRICTHCGWPGGAREGADTASLAEIGCWLVRCRAGEQHGTPAQPSTARSARADVVTMADGRRQARARGLGMMPLVAATAATDSRSGSVRHTARPRASPAQGL